MALKLENVEFNDLGNARVFLEVHGEDLRFWIERDKWLWWNGAYWEVDHGNEVRHRACSLTALFKDLGDNLSKQGADDDTVARVRRWACGCGNKSRINNLIDLAETVPKMIVHSEELDRDPWLLNCENGSYDLKRGQLYPHDRSDMITTSTGHAFDAYADLSVWVDLVSRVACHREPLVQYLQAAIGYSLTQSCKEQALFLAYGTGSNGKTTFLETIQRALGGYSTTAQYSSFLSANESVDKPRPDLLRLIGKRLIVVNEPEAGKSVNEGLIKQLTGGDKIVARDMNKSHYFEFEFSGKIWINCNARPTIKGSDHGIWRRLSPVPFDAVFDPAASDFDPDIQHKITDNIPGVLRWVVEGARIWRKNGLPQVDETTGAKRDYQLDQDPLHDFLVERTIADEDSFCTVNDLYSAYRRYCEGIDEQPLRKRTFSARLLERRLKKGLAGQRRLSSWIGIRLMHGEYVSA